MQHEFNETTDLYLQLLRKAQAVEDPRLVCMILERLKSGSPYLLAGESTCVVIPFPAINAPPEALLDESRFWPRLAATQVGIIVAIYTMMVVGHSIFV